MNSLSRRMMLASSMAALAHPVLAQAPAGRGGGRGPAGPPQPPVIERFSPALDALIDSGAKVERIVDGVFQWAEGPVWIGGADGYLLISDPRLNKIFRWTPKDGLTTWMEPSGLQTPVDPKLYREAGTNGLFLGRGGIIAADSGTRAIVRIDIATKQRTVLADRFEGKRLNSPNDLVVSPTTGMIYFTDPPYGLVNLATPEQRGEYINPLREMNYAGVFSLSPNNTVSLIGRYLMPNGVAVSPDGRKVDASGNIWTSGDSGIGIFTPQGQRLGRIRIQGSAPNCEFGADGHLYIAGGTGVYRVPVKAKKLTIA